MCCCDCCRGAGEKPILHYWWNCLFVRQPPRFQHLIATWTTGSHTNILTRHQRTRTCAHTTPEHRRTLTYLHLSRRDIVAILKELQGSLLLFSPSNSPAYISLLSSPWHTQTMNPYKRQGHVVPAYFLIYTSPLCGPWRTCTATRKNKPKQVQLRNLPWRFLF